jgi:hypothetical protein
LASCRNDHLILNDGPLADGLHAVGQPRCFLKAGRDVEIVSRVGGPPQRFLRAYQRDDSQQQNTGPQDGKFSRHGTTLGRNGETIGGLVIDRFPEAA